LVLFTFPILICPTKPSTDLKLNILADRRFEDLFSTLEKIDEYLLAKYARECRTIDQLKKLSTFVKAVPFLRKQLKLLPGKLTWPTVATMH